ncbi:hypothetical protein [Geodermatophilus sp. URMC 64]
MSDRRQACYSSAVIPTSWTPVTRPSDTEHVGYLVPDGDGRVVPTSLVGSALGPARDRGAAVALLVERGLAGLDRRWWCRLPTPLPAGVLAAREPERGWEWRLVVVIEASPEGCTVRPEWPAPEELTARAALPVPVGDLLREAPP